jgi:Mg2+-importing ATPase
MWQNPIAPGSPFWEMKVDAAFNLLGSGPEGLTQANAQSQLKPERKIHPLLREIRLFFSGFSDPMMILLMVAVFLSAVLGETTDAIIIAFILLSSASLAYFLHSRAGRLLMKLQALVVPDSGIVREGKFRRIPSWQVVPGDVLQLRAGDVLPADCLLLEANELHANESGFTGESFPVRKQPGILPAKTRLQQRRNCLWKGSNIVSGSGLALAIHTGDQAMFGTLVRDAGNPKPNGFESGLKEFGYFLLRITLVLSLLVLVLNFFRNKSLLDSALFSLALAVGMAPELLPAITTMAMSAGAARMLEKKVIVKDINSIQNLGEISLLCTDKTGTLTEGRIRPAGFKNPAGDENEFVRQLTCLNAALSSGYANPMEEALRKILVEKPNPDLKTGEVPYDFIRKRVSISVKNDDAFRLICKGSFHSLMEICDRVLLPDGRTEPIDAWKEKLEMAYQEYGSSGLRSLLVAYREMEKSGAHKADEAEMILAGFALFHDPVKSGVEAALEELRQLKVGLKILSGDSLPVLLSMAKKIGMHSPKTMTGAELDKTGSDALAHLVLKTDLFAELEPRQKERIIQALRKKHILAYMGDGINDVTALHAADVGISVSNAAGIAIEASDFVLLRKDISVLAEGIREGRRTFANTMKYIFISTGSTFGNMFSVAIASLFLPFIPMLPKQILLTNFISDFPFLSVSSDRVDEEQILQPGRWQISLVRDFMLVFGLHSSAFDLLTFFFLFHWMKLDSADFQTAWFMESVLTEILVLFVVRTQRPFYKSLPAMPLLWLGIIAMVFTILLPWLPNAELIGLFPQSLTLMSGLFVILISYLFTADALKHWFFKRHRNH